MNQGSSFYCYCSHGYSGLTCDLHTGNSKIDWLIPIFYRRWTFKNSTQNYIIYIISYLSSRPLYLLLLSWWILLRGHVRISSMLPRCLLFFYLCLWVCQFTLHPLFHPNPCLSFTVIHSFLPDACASYPCPNGGSCYVDMYGYPQCSPGICCFFFLPVLMIQPVHSTSSLSSKALSVVYSYSFLSSRPLCILSLF